MSMYEINGPTHKTPFTTGGLAAIALLQMGFSYDSYTECWVRGQEIAAVVLLDQKQVEIQFFNIAAARMMGA